MIIAGESQLVRFWVWLLFYIHAREMSFEGGVLQELQLEDVEETGEELGKGSYGIVLELKVKGLR